jgi:WD40 repeat protein
MGRMSRVHRVASSGATLTRSLPIPRRVFTGGFAALLGSALSCAPQARAPSGNAGRSRVRSHLAGGPEELGVGGRPVIAGGVATASFSADGRFAAVGGAGVEILSFPSCRRVRAFNSVRVRGHALALSRTGASVAVSGRGSELELWRVQDGTRVTTLQLEAPPLALAFSPTADLLAIGGEEYTLGLRDLSKGRWLWRKRAPRANIAGDVRTLAFSSDGRFLLSGGQFLIGGGWDSEEWEESPRLWRVADGVQLRSFDHSLTPTAWSADTHRVASATASRIWIWERESGRNVAMLSQFPLSPGGRYVVGVALSKDGSRAHSLGSDGALIEWDVTREREVRRVQAHADAASAFAVSPDGRFAITGAGDGRVRIWDLAKLTELTSGLALPQK